MTSLKQYFPFLDWLLNYQKENLRGDLTAGLTVAVMLIPQGMAYAMLAGLPPIIGLYASVVPLLVYALLGTSRHLAVGPVAMVSLLVAAGIGEIAQSGSEAYLSYAIFLSLLIGALQFLMGLSRLGFLVNFISHPVISGFTSAAALIIGFSQLKNLLGIDIPRSHHIHSILYNALQQLSAVHLPTLLIGAGSIALMALLKKWKPAFPGALTVVVTGTLAVSLFDLEQAGVRIVGEVPRGLPSPALPQFDMAALETLLPIAFAIALVSFMESISVAKAVASRFRYPVDANQELIGLGAANMVGSFFQAYPVTGGFSRTAVNADAGAKTALASFITAGVIAVTLLFFTPLFRDLPVAVLAAIIMVAVLGLIDVNEFRHLLKVKRIDALMLLITFAATLIWGIEPGILLGVGLSIFLFLVRSTRPHYAILGRLPNSTIYRNVKRFPEAREIAGLAILRIDASFYFGNVNFLQERIAAIVNRRRKEIRAIIIDASGVNYIDGSADAALQEIWEDFQRQGIELYMANLKGPVRDVMKRSGFYDRLGADHCFFSVHAAVSHFQSPSQHDQYSSEMEIEF